MATITAPGPRGTATGELTIVGGDDALALMHPMGWNSWNAFGARVTDAHIRGAADAMVEKGLAAHGYQYIVIDDGWEGTRDANGVLQPNEKFPDMKALADYVHSRGLKFGIYSSPGPTTCQGLPGSYGYERIDAETWAEWGVDFLVLGEGKEGTLAVSLLPGAPGWTHSVPVGSAALRRLTMAPS